MFQLILHVVSVVAATAYNMHGPARYSSTDLLPMLLMRHELDFIQMYPYRGINANN